MQTVSNEGLTVNDDTVQVYSTELLQTSVHTCFALLLKCECVCLCAHCSEVDENPDYDNLDIVSRDAEDKYFDDDEEEDEDNMTE